MAEPAFSVGSFATLPTSSSFVTCAAASSKFVLLGLSNGTLTLYDVFGNLLDSYEALHVGPVAAVALCDEVIASVGSARNDIRVARLFTGAGLVVGNDLSGTGMLTKATVSFVKNAAHPVLALAIDPNFGKPRYGYRVAYAEQGGRVCIHTAGWFGGSDYTVEEPSAMLVTDLKWMQNMLAVAGKDAVKVHDTRANRPICVIAGPGSTAPASPATLAKPSTWAGEQRGGFRSKGRSAVGQQREGAEARTTTLPSSTQADRVNANSAQPIIKDEAEGDRRTLQEGRWILKTKVYMEINDNIALSPHGEATVLVYITWPSGSRIVQIGPLKEVKPPEQAPQREIEIICRLERAELSFADSQSESITKDDVDITSIEGPHEGPLLSFVPFGDGDAAALVGTRSQELVLHLISTSEGKSVKSMHMPYHGLWDADLLAVPGGDPLVLIVGHWPSATLRVEKDEGNAEEVGGVVYVRSLTTAERVKWLLGQGRFSDALHTAQSAPGGSLRRAEVSLEDVGEQFLESLHESGDYKKLASVLPETITMTAPYVGFRARDRVMAKRVRRWKQWISIFWENGHLGTVAPVVPTYEPCLPEQSYNEILVELARTNSTVMLEVLKTWPADVFGVSAVTKAIEERLAITGDGVQNTMEREPLREGLLMMYGLSGRHDETLNLLLREKSPQVYDYIRSHHLYEAVRSRDTISGLYMIDADAATDILSHAPETVLPPGAVVPILLTIDNPTWTFMYLHAMFRIDADQAPQYHNQLLKLYVDHGSSGMLFTFLRTSKHYTLDRALREMGGPKGFKKGQLANERVFVLSGMGDLNSAMDILLDELGDTHVAIEFASDHGDKLLWERLIDHARTHADTLAALLDSPAGGKVDPVRLVPLLTAEMKIPHLRDRLHRILVDAALERALREDATAALHHDASVLLNDLDECISVMP